MIIKVQLSIFTNHEKRRVMAYDETRTYKYEGDATPEILKLMGGDLKAFFVATPIHGVLDIVKRAEWQEW